MVSPISSAELLVLGALENRPLTLEQLQRVWTDSESVKWTEEQWIELLPTVLGRLWQFCLIEFDKNSGMWQLGKIETRPARTIEHHTRSQMLYFVPKGDRGRHHGPCRPLHQPPHRHGVSRHGRR